MTEGSRFVVTPFIPRQHLSNGHLQTIVGNYLARTNNLPVPTAEFVEVVPSTDSLISSQVLCHCHWQPLERRADALTVMIVHGLEGSSSSQYVVGNADKLWKAGCNVIRMNMRNCCGTEHLSPTLYHSGLSSDVAMVMQHFVSAYDLQAMALVGYSMGGNLVLKFAGELGRSAPKALRCVVGVSPAIDLGPSADALHQPVNRVYEWKFLFALLKRFRHKAALFPQRFDVARAKHIYSIRQFDDVITAPYSGFADADDYYYRAAAARVLSQIEIPTLILHAKDDPFVHITPESCAAIAANPAITYIETVYGGHCAFLEDADLSAGYDGYWAEKTLLRFLLAHREEK